MGLAHWMPTRHMTPICRPWMMTGILIEPATSLAPTFATFLPAIKTALVATNWFMLNPQFNRYILKIGPELGYEENLKFNYQLDLISSNIAYYFL